MALKANWVLGPNKTPAAQVAIPMMVTLEHMAVALKQDLWYESPLSRLFDVDGTDHIDARVQLEAAARKYSKTYVEQLVRELLMDCGGNDRWAYQAEEAPEIYGEVAEARVAALYPEFVQQEGGGA